MATKHGLKLCVMAVVAQLALFGCGGNAQFESSDANGAPPSESPAAPPLGWSIRDTTPYSRIEHATVLDEAHDRMIVIGGAGGLDVWALPLSGKGQFRWVQIVPAGDSPATVDVNGGHSVAAAYDPLAQRVLVLRADSYNFETPQVWQLTLDDAPTWQQLSVEGPDPGAELDQGKMVFDRERNRALVVGGGANSSGTWSLSLDGSARWTRIAGAPAVETFTQSPFPVGINAGAWFIDSRRDRAVMVTGSVREDSVVWTLPLSGGDWSLEARGPCGADYDASSVYDSARDRVIFVGGQCGVSFYELATGEWQTATGSNWFTARDASRLVLAMSSIDDAKRRRALFFSGGIFAGNATTALGYDDLSVLELVPNTLGVGAGTTAAVWDEQRQELVAFGADDAAPTRAHGLEASDRWRDLAGPQPPFSVGVYDPYQRAVVVIGHPYPGKPEDGEDVARLSSSGSAWEKLLVSAGPNARNWPVAVYDSVQRRLVVHGGEEVGGESPAKLNDTWALSLDGDPHWAELVTSGNSGGGRSRQAAIYDPVGQRMISYGNIDNRSDRAGDLHQLMLDDSLEWSQLQAMGSGPAVSDAVALYDPRGERMLVLARNRLFALTLAGEPTWHRFCETGLGMPGSNAAFIIGADSSSRLLGLAPDGLFAALGDGTFRFNLDTPYCD